jgi:hypothetical protein
LEGIIGNSDGTSGSLAFHPWLPLLASVTSSFQRASPTCSTTFRFCFCPEPRPQMPVVRMLAGGGTHNGHTCTDAEHGGSCRWTERGALFDCDSDYSLTNTSAFIHAMAQPGAFSPCLLRTVNCKIHACV